jgi:GDP-4-dehydro-6-deoxy-D-mannose reductase
MTILVTGASGFAGSHLIEQLSKTKEHTIFGTVFRDAATDDGSYTPISVDLTNESAVQSLIQKVKPDQIYHLASFSFVGESFQRGAELLQNNLLLQSYLLDAVQKYAPKAKLLVVGSAEEYGLSEEGEIPIREDHPFRPVNPYAVSKLAQDMLAYSYSISHQLQIVRVRPFNHIGERQTTAFAIPAFAHQIVEIERGKKEKLEVGNLEGIRDFTDVKDMVSAYILLMEKGVVGDVYNVGSGVGVSMKDVVRMLSEMATVPVETQTDASRLRPLDIPIIVADSKKIQALGWKTTIPLKETLKRVLEYWRQQA